MDMQYVYSATQNNGRITQSIDNYHRRAGNYQYDQLNRLMRAETADNAWGEAVHVRRFWESDGEDADEG